MSVWWLLLTVYLACAVEAVEAVTIVLAAGTSRNWRSALTGVGAGLVVLAALVGVLGPALTAIPLNALRLVVGGLLLVFGLQWLRKAILRASGLKALHDEEAIFAREAAALAARPLQPEARSSPGPRSSQDRRPLGERVTAALVGVGSVGRFAISDWYAFTLSFKGVLLEGLEVVFIVLTFGANQHAIGWAALGALLAVLSVVGLALAVRAPLARVPENTMKFAVGVLLTSFGMFWGAEGAGARWPGSDAAILILVAVTAVGSLGAVAVLRRTAEV